MKPILIIGLLGIVLILDVSISDAYAYIDPASGSIFIQAIVGAIVGVGIALKIYWYQFKEKILGIRKKDE